MRYLVEWNLKPVPPEMAKTALALVEATEAWVGEEKKAGRVIENWTNTGGMGGIAIWEVESNDALDRKLWECPMWPFVTYCVSPLTDFKLSAETFKNLMKQMIKG